MMKQNYAVRRFNYISQIKQKSPASQQGFFYAHQEILYIKIANEEM